MKTAVLIFLLLPLLCFCQKKSKKDILTSDLDSVQYNLDSKTLAPSNINLPFNSIEILDARFDTSKLGFEIHKEYAELRTKDFKRIKLVGGIDKSLQLFYNEYYKLCLKESSNKLLIVVKTLWLNSLPGKKYYENKRYDIEKESYQNINIKFEYYLKRDNEYFALKRVDTVYQLTESVLRSKEVSFKKNDLSFFTYAIKSLIEKFDFTSLIEKAANTKKFSIHQIDSFNRKRFLLPVLTASNLNYGVFFNFKDFSSNAPATTDYKFKRIKGQDFLYIKNDSANSHLYFAISDSTGLHFSSSKRNDIIRIANTFEFFSFDDIYLPKTAGGNLLSMAFGYPGYGDFTGARKQYVLVPRQINMETGEIY